MDREGFFFVNEYSRERFFHAFYFTLFNGKGFLVEKLYLMIFSLRREQFFFDINSKETLAVRSRCFIIQRIQPIIAY